MNPTAEQVINATVAPDYRVDAMVMVSKSREFGQHVKLRPTDIVPDHDNLNTVFIFIPDLTDIPMNRRFTNEDLAARLDLPTYEGPVEVNLPVNLHDATTEGESVKEAAPLYVSDKPKKSKLPKSERKTPAA